MQTPIMAPISLENPLVQTYIVYAAILSLKVLFMSYLTGRLRHKRGVVANPEDVAAVAGGKARIKYDDPDVERVRRAHLNDLENIPVFLAVGLLYVLTGPSVWLATLLFRLYAAGRFLHTVVYAMVVLPQPSRGLAFGVPYLITWYMGIQVLLHFLGAL